MKDLYLKELTNKTLPYFISCFRNNGSPKEKAQVKWQYLENPVKKQFVDIAIDSKSDIVAAIYAIFPVKFKLGNDIYIGSQSLDTMTDKNFRGQGLFIKLANS